MNLIVIEDKCTSSLAPDPFELEYTYNINEPSTDFVLDLDATAIDCSFTVTAITGGPGSGITFTNNGLWFNDEQYYSNRWDKQAPWEPPQMILSDQTPTGSYTLEVTWTLSDASQWV